MPTIISFFLHTMDRQWLTRNEKNYNSIYTHHNIDIHGRNCYHDCSLQNQDTSAQVSTILTIVNHAPNLSLHTTLCKKKLDHLFLLVHFLEYSYIIDIIRNTPVYYLPDIMTVYSHSECYSTDQDLMMAVKGHSLTSVRSVLDTECILHRCGFISCIGNIGVYQQTRVS